MFLNAKRSGLISSVISGAAIASLSLSAILPANAQGDYVPPTGRDRPQRTQGGGSRGCPNFEPVSLRLLIPNDHTALTVTAHPTFAWHLSAVPSMPVQFALTETGSSQPILVKQFTPKQAGLVKFTLPPDAPTLEIGKEYRWTVSLVCNGQHPSQSVYARAWVERVSASPDLTRALTGSRSGNQKAMSYAAKGIWYDALAELLEVPQTGSERSEASMMLKAMLHQVGFDQVLASK
jgi:hypothetical protein